MRRFYTIIGLGGMIMKRYQNMLSTTRCKRCGKELATLNRPIYSSVSTMNKYQGICKDCMSKSEQFNMMLDMNDDVRNKV